MECTVPWPVHMEMVGAGCTLQSRKEGGCMCGAMANGAGPSSRRGSRQGVRVTNAVVR